MLFNKNMSPEVDITRPPSHHHQSEKCRTKTNSKQRKCEQENVCQEEGETTPCEQCRKQEHSEKSKVRKHNKNNARSECRRKMNGRKIVHSLKAKQKGMVQSPKVEKERRKVPKGSNIIIGSSSKDNPRRVQHFGGNPPPPSSISIEVTRHGRFPE